MLLQIGSRIRETVRLAPRWKVSAFAYTDLKAGLSIITPPDVQTRALVQARMALGAANTMRPDPKALTSLLTYFHSPAAATPDFYPQMRAN